MLLFDKDKCNNIVVLSTQMHSIINIYLRKLQCLYRDLSIFLRRLLQTTLRVSSNS